jgi:hypothetical protein
MWFFAGPNYCGVVRFSTWGPLTIPLTLFRTKERLTGGPRGHVVVTCRRGPLAYNPSFPALFSRNRLPSRI